MIQYDLNLGNFCKKKSHLTLRLILNKVAAG
jgi:hypothetical protein